MVAIGRILKGAGRLLFDPVFTDETAKALQATRKTQGWQKFHKQIGDAFIKGEKESLRQNPKLLEGMKKSLTTLPGDMKGAWKGATGGWAKTKAIGGQLMKRMPLIGGIMMVGFELPNIISAFKNEGLIGGLTEIVKSGGRCLGSMAGFAIGQALIPIPVVGGLIGAFAGDWLVSKITGKSHNEKKAEMEEALAQANGAEQQAQMLQQQLMANPYNPYANNMSVPQMTMTPQQIAQMQQMLSSGYGLNDPMNQDFMAMTSGINRLNYMC